VEKATRVIAIKFFAIGLPSQPFLGHLLGFNITMAFSRASQLGCFGLDKIIIEIF